MAILKLSYFSTSGLATGLFFNVIPIRDRRLGIALCNAYTRNIARFLVKEHVITYLLYQHPPRVPLTGVPRARAVPRAIELTILVFTMKFQTGGGWWGRRGCRRVKEERRREKERAGGVGWRRGEGRESCAGDGNIDGTSGRCFGAKTPAEQRERVDGGGQAGGRGGERCAEGVSLNN